MTAGLPQLSVDRRILLNGARKEGKALVKALAIAFAKASEIGAAQKAIIFTESRKTQNYLLRVLADSPFKDGIVLFNGLNTDDRSKAIYAAWLDRHAGTDRVSGSKSADMRSALVDYFREEGRIMTRPKPAQKVLTFSSAPSW